MNTIRLSLYEYTPFTVQLHNCRDSHRTEFCHGEFNKTKVISVTCVSPCHSLLHNIQVTKYQYSCEILKFVDCELKYI